MMTNARITPSPAATYPVMTYRSDGIRHDGHGFVLDGELTIRGATRPVSLTLEVNGFAVGF